MRNALDQFGQAADLGGDDDPGVTAALLLPFDVECDEVDNVEGEDRAPLVSGMVS